MSEQYEPGLVSVIVPTWNRARFLVEALDSVLAQTYRPIELLVIDDGSTDGTEQLVAEWGRKCVDHPHFTLGYLRQENQGAPVARNLGLIESHGEFIQFLDSDDLLDADKLECQVAWLNNNPEIQSVYGDWTLGPTRDHARHRTLGSHADMVEALLCKGWVAPFSYLTRRSAAREAGPWNVRLPVDQDFDYFLRVAILPAKFQHLSRNTGFYRLHSDPRISQKSNKVYTGATLEILLAAESNLRSRNTLSESRAWALAHRYLDLGRKRFAEDPEFFRHTLEEIQRICPDFRPRNALYRLLVSLIGYQVTQKYVNLLRAVRRHFLGVIYGA